MTDKELSIELIRENIYLIRGQKVMLDRDLAQLYGVETFNLNKAVKRNMERFPEDFMFELNKQEMSLIFQFGISKNGRGGTRKPAKVFTEQGIAMLSSVLNSKQAILVNTQIVRAFVKIRELMTMHNDIFKRMNKLEINQLEQNKEIRKINQVIEEMLGLPVTLKRKNKTIGFKKE